jgi:hypothetical protein
MDAQLIAMNGPFVLVMHDGLRARAALGGTAFAIDEYRRMSCRNLPASAYTSRNIRRMPDQIIQRRPSLTS